MAEMTLSQMRTLIQQLMGDDNGTMFPNALVQSFINRAQQDIARDLEAIVSTVTISTLAADKSYVLPSDFIQVKRLLWAGLPLWPQTYDYISQREIPNGTPFAYYIVGQSLHFFPKPTTVPVVTMEYVASPDYLVSDNDTSALPDTAVKAIIYSVVRNLKLRDDDYDGFDKVNEEYQSTLAAGKFDRTMHNADSYTGIRTHEEYSHGGTAWNF